MIDKFLEGIKNDFEKNCKHIDEFNKDILKQVDKNNQELAANLDKMFQQIHKPITASLATLIPQQKIPRSYNPYAD